MKYALNPASIGGLPPFPEYLRLAANHGFSGVEMGIEPVQKLVSETSLDDARSLYAQFAVSPACFFLPVEWRLDQERFDADVAALPARARLSQDLGCDRIATWLPPAIDVDPVSFRARTRDRFATIATILADHGLRFGLEWVGPDTYRHGPLARGTREFIHTMPATLDLIADINAPDGNVGLLVDSFHWYTSGGTVADLTALSPDQIVHVHINDAPDRPISEQVDSERLLPGEGVIDLHAFLGALRTVGYDGYIGVEVFNQELSALGHDAAAGRVAESLRDL